MKVGSFRVAAACLGLMLAGTAWPAPPPIAQAEITYLLTFVEQSGCAFNRNGSWYDSKRAREHLHTKYKALLAGHHVDTAEDFIAKAGSQSSLSGRAYLVRCGEGPVTPCSEWLTAELLRFRSQGTPRAARGVPANISRLS
jgi:hypothetical protein